MIPRAVDDYLTFLDAYPRQAVKERLGNPGVARPCRRAAAARTVAARAGRHAVSFAMLLNLAAVANSEEPAVLWGFLRRYAPGVSPETYPRLDALVRFAVRYYRDFVRPAKLFRAPDAVERDAFARLDAALAGLPADADAEAIQAALYDVARPIPRYQDFAAKGATPERPGVSNEWFNALYQVLLGEPKGPRFGSFVALYGISETRTLIGAALDGTLAADHVAFLRERESAAEVAF